MLARGAVLALAHVAKVLVAGGAAVGGGADVVARVAVVVRDAGAAVGAALGRQPDELLARL